MRFHPEHQVEENVNAGMNLQEAGYAALRQFAGVEQIEKECRDRWGVHFMETLIHDLRFGFRQLIRKPGFRVVAVVLVAIVK